MGRIVAVTGATGLQGGAVARRLREGGWQVRALTRDPSAKKARPLAAVGVEVVKADMEEPTDLARAFDGAQGVFCVQNHHVSGYDGELRQAMNVTDMALKARVPHVVYASAGVGVDVTGVGSWDVKVTAEAYMREQGLPVTILRPMAFMELMTAKKFFPPASTWNVMPRLLGQGRPVGWLAVEDMAIIVERVLSDREAHLGEVLSLAADVQSIAECREIVRDVTGRPPRRMPMPLSLFRRFVGTDEIMMWEWLRTHEFDLDTSQVRAIHPDALTVRQWLSKDQ